MNPRIIPAAVFLILTSPLVIADTVPPSVGWIDDCNANGLPDADDIAGGWSLDANTDGVPDECQSSEPVRTLDGPAGTEFGATLAASADWLAVGAPGDDGAAPDAGAVHLYRRNGNDWTADAVVRPPGIGPDDRVGRAIAVNDDWLLIGAARHDGAGAQAGLAWLYARTDTGWVLAQTIAPNDAGPGLRFGAAVALDGARAVVGATGADTSRGAVYVFELVDDVWDETARLTIADANPFDRFGALVALRGDVVAAVLGGTDDRAVVFEGAAGTWTPVAEVASGNNTIPSLLLAPEQVLIATPQSGPFGSLARLLRDGERWSTADPAEYRPSFSYPGRAATDGDRLAGVSGSANFIGVLRRCGDKWLTERGLVLPGDDSTERGVEVLGDFVFAGIPHRATVAIFDLGALDNRPDTNENGVWDACEIAAGTLTDCNGNGWSDAWELAVGAATDCNADGRPDDCETTYRADDGSHEHEVTSTNETALCLNAFVVEAGKEVIDAVSVRFARPVYFDPVWVIVYADPNGDGHPGDAEVLHAELHRPQIAPAEFGYLPLRPTYVGPAGTPFFVGVIADSDRELRYDMSQRDSVAWLARYYGPVAGAPLRPSDWAVPPRSIASISSFALRAHASLAGPCPCDFDLDGSGAIDITEIVRLLSAWGVCDGCEEDITGDGVVDLSDLAFVLSAWGVCE